MFHHFESLNVRKLMLKWQYERQGRVSTWKVKCRNGSVLLTSAPAKRDLIPAPFIEHFIPTQMENKILIKSGLSIVFQGISVLHRVNSPGWPQFYRLDWWWFSCWPEDRILSIMWGNLAPCALWTSAPSLAMCERGTFLSHFILNRVIPRPT